MFPYFKWDGGIILIHHEHFHEAIHWYSKHMGWTCRERFANYHGEKAFLTMPGGGQIVLKAVDSTYEHLSLDNRHDGEARFCFAIGDWERTIKYFNQHGIKFTEPKYGPDNRKYIDLYTYDNTRITAVHQSKFQGKYPDSRLVSYAEVPLRFGVTDLEASVSWYCQFLGLVPSERETPDGSALLKGKSPYQAPSYFGERVWLEQAEQLSGPTNPSARPYFYLEREAFLNVHQRFPENGIECSPIVGDPDWWAVFHCYDPDGNRINVSTCRL